ncbi:putative membrane protein [[Clostridium] sordellii VPI 9048]|nr:putative membrane protein [[Clostridium] sordellii VPI 9048] [Paeniclostridium sordellii VPI 9048]
MVLIIINAITYVFIGELFYISEFISGIFLGFSTGIIIFMNTIRSDYEEK